MAERSRPSISRVRTTPLTCGAQASVTIRIRWWAARVGAAGAEPGSAVIEPSLGGSGRRDQRLGLENGTGAFAKGRPAENLQVSAGIFDKGGAAFNPVAVVEIEDAADPLDRSVMNMAAHDAVEAACARLMGHGILEAADILDRILHLRFEIGRERPVGEPQGAPHRAADLIELERHRVGPVAQMGEPLSAGDDAVELIAVQDQ